MPARPHTADYGGSYQSPQPGDIVTLDAPVEAVGLHAEASPNGRFEVVESVFDDGVFYVRVVPEGLEGPRYKLSRHHVRLVEGTSGTAR